MKQKISINIRATLWDFLTLPHIHKRFPFKVSKIKRRGIRLVVKIGCVPGFFECGLAAATTSLNGGRAAAAAVQCNK
jgi:hypothetical protein